MGTSGAVHIDSDSGSDSELTRSPFTTVQILPATAQSTLKELMYWHRSLNLDENVNRICIWREDLWHKSIGILKKPQFDLYLSYLSNLKVKKV